MTHRTLPTLAATATLAGLALPGAALGATFTALKPCYVSLGTAAETEAANLAGSGFTPNARVDIAMNGAPVVSGVPVDAAGNLGADPTAPVLVRTPTASGEETRFTVTATEQGANAPAATGTSRVTPLSVTIRPTRARPSSRVRFRGRGFTGKGRVYAHYRYKERTRKRVSFKPRGACGTFDARKRQIPVARVRTGEWTVQFDQQKKYELKPDTAFVRLKIIVSRTVKFSRDAQASAFGLR